MIESRLMSAFAVAFALLPASPAGAHALLRKAIPATGSTVTVAPEAVELLFSEGVEPTLCTVEVRDAAGTDVETGAVRTAEDNRKRLIAPLKSIGAGVYTVVWHATSVDTHKTEGRFVFTVAP